MTILLLPERKHLTSPLINRWLARGDRLPDEPAGDEALLRSVFAFDGPLAVAALTRQWDVGDADGAQWLRADPAWLRADMMTARMFAHGELGLSAAEVASLAPDLAALFADHDLAFDAPTPTRWYLRCPDELRLPAFANPDDALGDDLKLHLPPGADGKFWRVLTNDIQILLHNHPVNQRRAAQGAVTANGLWLWGGGRLPARTATTATRIHTDDIVVQAFARQAGGVDCLSLQNLEQAGTSRSAVIDLRHLRGESLQALTAAVATASRRHRDGVVLRFASGERYRYLPVHRWRIWRSSP